MAPPGADDSPVTLLQRLERATNAHDLDAVVDCFAETYVNETPTHPARGFAGREQVRANWRQIFAGVPDLRARVLRAASDGDTIWSEWEMSGTRRDGSPHVMGGVVIFRVAAGRASAARFYLEPVEEGGGDVNSAVASQVATAR